MTVFIFLNHRYINIFVNLVDFIIIASNYDQKNYEHIFQPQ